MDICLLGKEPINPNQPTGSDVRYEPEFEELQAEIDKLSSPSATGGIDWKKVTILASTILAKKSKDILVASYLSVAQIHTNEIEGLAIGLRLYHDLLEQFWEDLYPPKKRMRGRRGAIEWWLEKTESALKQLNLNSVSPEKVEQLKENLEQIDKLLNEKLQKPPSVRGVQRLFETIPSPSEEKPEPKVPPELKPEKLQKKVPLSQAEDIVSEKESQRILRVGLQKINQVAVFCWGIDPASPQVYRYARIAVWTPVDVLPPVINGRTRIPPPATHARKLFNDLRKKGDWKALLKSAEQKLSQFIFWLDLNRLVAEALAELGDRYQKALDAVCQETAFWAHRLPGLNDLLFSDGSPCADTETKQWMKSIALGTIAVMAEPIDISKSASNAQVENQMAETIQKAQDLAKKKKLVESVESIQQKIRNSFSQRETLLWRLALSQIIVSSKQAELAVPHFEQILQDIEMYRLEKWDPELALKGFKAVWAGFNTYSDKTFKTRAVDTLNRIARLDPAEALRLKKR
ncbi:MAG: type VI secretion system protein TssA [Desulfobacteraceae bacterium]|nr:type VI secretion system protein TssA [Desulfobacteraceae bacterium]MBC2718949.1 type VI secretion system protein TssA [Desulfobacteraceae bacterium]